MKQKIHAIATALAELRHKVNGLGLKATGQFRQKQSTNRLSLRPSAQPGAPLITMTAEGGSGLRFNNDTPTAQNHAKGSGGPVKRRAGSMALRDEGSFYLDSLVPFSSRRKELALVPAMRDGKAEGKGKKELCEITANVQSSNKQSTNRLSLRPGAQPTAPLITMTMERGEAMQFNNDTPTAQSHATGSGGPVKRRAGSWPVRMKDRFTLPFWSLFWLRKKELSLRGYEREDCCSKNDFQNEDNRKPSQKPLTNRLSLRSNAEPSAPLITMTGKEEEVRFNRSIPNSNAPSLPNNSALAVAEKVQKFLHCHCSNWRSGEFFWLLFLRKKKSLALRGNEREAYHLKDNPKQELIGQYSKKPLTNRLSLRPNAQPDAPLITMTMEGGEAMQFNENHTHDKPTVQIHATGSGGPVKRRAGSWPVRMKDRFTLPFWFLFWLRKKELSLRGYEREDYSSKNNFQNKDNPKPSHKLSTNRLLLRPGAYPTAPLITMTAKGGESPQFSRTRRYRKHQTLRPNLLILASFLVVIISGTKTRAQTGSLQIGDTIPEAVWNMPLQVTNHPEKKNSIRLGDYRGRLIILDFWATWCVNCIKSFPEEGRLQQEFGDRVAILPVTAQEQGVVNAFMQRDNPTRGSRLTVVTGDRLLSSTFKHQLMPHVVWIDGEGRFIASTAASYVRADKIQQALGRQKLNWTMKRDFMEFNRADALMGWMDHGGATPKIYGYSAFTGHLSGVDPVSGILADTAAGSQRRYDINVPLRIFSVRAFGGTLPVLSRKQYLYKVSRLQDYICPAGTLYIDWKVRHTYCYEAVLPASYSGAQIRQKMREDLKSYFGLEGKLEYRKVSAWVFHKQEAGPKTPAGDSRSLASLIWELNEQHPELPLAIDQTGSKDLQVPKMETVPLSLAGLNNVLGPYGISVEAEESEQPFFVLYEGEKSDAKP